MYALALPIRFDRAAAALLALLVGSARSTVEIAADWGHEIRSGRPRALPARLSVP